MANDLCDIHVLSQSKKKKRYSCFVWCSRELNTTSHEMEKWVLALNFDGGFWKTASHSPTRGKNFLVVITTYLQSLPCGDGLTVP